MTSIVHSIDEYDYHNKMLDVFPINLPAIVQPQRQAILSSGSAAGIQGWQTFRPGWLNPCLRNGPQIARALVTTFPGSPRPSSCPLVQEVLFYSLGCRIYRGLTASWRPGDAVRGYSSIVPRLILNLDDGYGGDGECCLDPRRPPFRLFGFLNYHTLRAWDPTKIRTNAGSHRV